MKKKKEIHIAIVGMPRMSELEIRMATKLPQVPIIAPPKVVEVPKIGYIPGGKNLKMHPSIKALIKK